jgi:cyanophycin synthetase
LNLIRLQNGARAMIDYAHNAAAIEGLLDFVMRLPAKRRVGVITVPGDRRDEDIRAAGKLAAQFDCVIIKEDSDLRGREPGEISKLLEEGLRSGGLGERDIRMIRDAVEAIEEGVRQVSEDDLLVVFAEKVPQTLAAIRAHAVTVS